MGERSQGLVLSLSLLVRRYSANMGRSEREERESCVRCRGKQEKKQADSERCFLPDVIAVGNKNEQEQEEADSLIGSGLNCCRSRCCCCRRRMEWKQETAFCCCCCSDNSCESLCSLSLCPCHRIVHGHLLWCSSATAAVTACEEKKPLKPVSEDTHVTSRSSSKQIPILTISVCCFRRRPFSLLLCSCLCLTSSPVCTLFLPPNIQS